MVKCFCVDTANMLMDDPLLDFSCALMMNEFPNMDTAMVPIVRSWIAQLLGGAIPYEEARQLVVEHCGAASFIDKIQDILTVSADPMPEPKTKAGSQMDLKGQRSKTRSWTSQEDNRLLAGVRRFGIGAGSTWSAIAEFVGNGRSRSQCSQRWIRVLDPRICKGQWTRQDDRILLDFVALYGEKSWMKIGAELGNRSDVQCRYRYLQLQRDESRPKSPARVMPADAPDIRSIQTLPAPPPGRTWLPQATPAVIAIPGHQDEQDPGEVKVLELAENVPIPLTTSLDLKRSDPLFDSTIWLWRME
jgi:hypothetical protein